MMEVNVFKNSVEHAFALLSEQRDFMSMSLATSAVLGILVTLLIYWASAGKSKALRDVPGPKPSILLGNLAEIGKKGYPDCHVDWINQYGPVSKYYLGHQEILLVADPELVRDILVRNFKTFYNRSIAPFVSKISLKAMVFAQGTYWAGVRNATLPLFHTDRLKNYGDIMHQNAGILVRRIEKRVGDSQPFNILRFAEAMALDVIGAAAFGIEFGVQAGEKNELQTLVLDTINKTTELRPSVLLSLLFGPRVGLISQDILRWIPYSADRAAYSRNHLLLQKSSAMSAGRRDDPEAAKRNDLLTLLARARTKDSESKALTDHEIACVIMEIMLAGSDTTANTIAFAVYLVTTHPQVQAKLLAEIDSYKPETLEGTNAEGVDSMRPSFDELDKFPYLEQVVKEALRLYPTGAAINRCPVEDTQIGSLKVPAGTNIIIPVYAMHRDPSLFPDPDLFRPERFDPTTSECKERHPYAYNPFGHGPRMCLGFKFAMEEARLTLYHLFQGFTFEADLEKSGVKDGSLELEAGIVLKPKHGIWVKAIPRLSK